jgi:Xaa-Pro aminopeptidase
MSTGGLDPPVLILEGDMAEAEPSRALSESEQLRHDLVREKHAQALQLMRHHGIDCWLTFTREGSDLLLPLVTGVEYIVGLSALMLFDDGASIAVVADYDTSQVDGLFDQVLPYSTDWREPFWQTLSERRPERIGINMSSTNYGVDGLTYGLYRLLVEELGPLGLIDRLVSAEPVTSLVRACKTEAEIERIRRAGAITLRIIDDLTTMMRPGFTEADVAELVHERMQTYEVTPAWEGAFCPTVATSRGDFGHSAPGMNKIEPGDTLRIDVGVNFEGYCSDLQRSWYFLKPGEIEPPEDVRRAFSTIREAIDLAAELVRPGVRGVDVDRPVRDLVEQAGYSFTHALGHQMGRAAHDGGLLLGPDNVRYGDQSRGEIVEGMVFTLEPSVPLVALEENVVVTANGCDYLAAPQRELALI